MNEENSGGAVRVTADTSGFEAAMREISQSSERFGRAFSASFRQAALSGRDLDDTLQSIASRLSSLALEQALKPLDDLAGSLMSSMAQAVAGANAPGSGAGAANIVFNVNSPDVSGFRRSENQIASLLARAVSRGQRGL